MTIIGVTRLHEAILAAGVAIISVNASGLVSPSSLQTAAQPTIDAFDSSPAADTAYLNTTARTNATTAIDTNVAADWKALRGAAAVLVDEINLLREWNTGLASAVAAASSLADLKTRVALLPALPDRTLAQAKTAIQNKITSGVVD